MNKSHFHIDFSKSKREEDLIKIRLRNEDVVQVNFSKLVSQSKYIRDKYKYSEASELIQQEIEKIEEKMKISDESIKYFIELIQDEKADLPIKHYKDIYTLSEYFYIQAITAELDKISQELLFKDLNFTIQVLHDYETVNNDIETKLTIKIENFLKAHINECIQNANFAELEVSTIYRLIEESTEKVEHNLLVDFILESAMTRFVMFKLVEVDKLSEDKLHEMIKFFESQEERIQKMYLEYMPFNFLMFKNMMNKYDQVLKEMNEIKINFDKMKEELDQTKIKENQTKQELDECKREMKETKDVLNQTKIKENQTKKELDECKREMKQVKDVLNQTKSENKRYTQSIIVAGLNRYNGLGEKPNNKAKNNYQTISPQLKLFFDPSSLLSYSSYCYHSVLVMSDGSLKGVGDNKELGKISSTLQKTVIKNFTDFCIKDGSGRQLAAVSVVCYLWGTLYMFSKSSGNERQLVLCDKEINGGDPVFLDIGSHHPVSLFGGFSHSAAIGSEGEVIFINRNSVRNSPNSPIASVSLPDGEKASSVACCDDSVVVLSLNGRVFSSKIESNGVLKFSIVSELSNEEIVCVSGTYEHFLAVSKKGRVFGRGSNEHGQLGLGEGTGSFSSFTEIQSFSGYEIRAAYAGWQHSLFETREGKILSCGWNYYGELLLSSDAGENIYLPTETTITGGASFCIAGGGISVVFIGNGPPPNTPNTRVLKYE